MGVGLFEISCHLFLRENAEKEPFACDGGTNPQQPWQG